MSFFCDDGEPAQITPWVPIPPGKRGAMEPLEHERDRCQRDGCRKLAWQHWNEPPVPSMVEGRIAELLAGFLNGHPLCRGEAEFVAKAFAKLLSRSST